MNEVTEELYRLYELCIAECGRLEKRHPFELTPVQIHRVAKRHKFDTSYVILFLLMYHGSDAAKKYVQDEFDYQYSIDDCLMAIQGTWY